MSSITFKYDPWRGGFCLQLGPFSRDHPVEAFGGLLTIYMSEGGRIAAIESFWDRGGLTLCGIHHGQQFLQADFPVAGIELDLGPLQLAQDEKLLELWFGMGNDRPRDRLTSDRDVETGISIWLPPEGTRVVSPVSRIARRAECQPLAGPAVEMARTVATYPIRLLRLAVEDFK